MGAIAAAGYSVFTEGFWSVQWRWIPNGSQTLLGALDWGPGLVSAVSVWTKSKACKLFFLLLFFYSSPLQNVLINMDGKMQITAPRSVNLVLQVMCVSVCVAGSVLLGTLPKLRFCFRFFWRIWTTSLVVLRKRKIVSYCSVISDATNKTFR